MRVIKRDIMDLEGQVDDKLYCIDDNGLLIYSLRDYRWSCTVESKREIEDMPEWALNDPYKNQILETDLKDLMIDMYDELNSSKVKGKSFEMER